MGSIKEIVSLDIEPKMFTLWLDLSILGLQRLGLKVVWNNMQDLSIIYKRKNPNKRKFCFYSNIKFAIFILIVVG